MEEEEREDSHDFEEDRASDHSAHYDQAYEDSHDFEEDQTGGYGHTISDASVNKYKAPFTGFGVMRSDGSPFVPEDKYGRIVPLSFDTDLLTSKREDWD